MNITVRSVKRAFSLPLSLSHTGRIFMCVNEKGKNKPNELSHLLKEAMALQSSTQKLRNGWKLRLEKLKTKKYVILLTKCGTVLLEMMRFMSVRRLKKTIYGCEFLLL